MLAHPGLSHVHVWVEKGDITSKVSILGLSVTVNIISNITVTDITRGYFIWDYSLLLLRRGIIPRWYPPIKWSFGITRDTKLSNARNPRVDASKINKMKPTCEKLCESNGDLHSSVQWVQVHHGLGGYYESMAH